MQFPDKQQVLAAGMALSARDSNNLSPILASLESLAAIDSPFPEQFGLECKQIVADIAAIDIKTHDDAEKVGELTRTAKAMAADIEKRRKEVTVYLDNAKSNIMGWVKPYLDDLAQAERIGKNMIGAYQAEQARIAQEEQRILREKAEAERRRLAEEAAAAEAKAKAEAEKLQAEAEQARQSGDTVAAAKLDAKAETKLEAGVAKVEAIQNKAETVVAPVLNTAPPKISGMSGRTVWTAEVKDKQKFLTYALNNPMFLQVVTFDQMALNRLAATMKEALSEVPGLEATSSLSIAARR